MTAVERDPERRSSVLDEHVLRRRRARHVDLGVDAQKLRRHLREVRPAGVTVGEVVRLAGGRGIAHGGRHRCGHIVHVHELPAAGPVHLVFKLRPDPPIPRATVVLELPPAPAGGWGGLVLEGSLKRSGRIDRRRGEVHFTDLMPGLYFFKLGDDRKKKPVQVQVETGVTVKLKLPDATVTPKEAPTGR